MSKVTKKNGWLNTKPNSAKTIVERAKREVPDFREHYAKFEQQTVIGGYLPSTIFNYSRAVAKISLHFKKSILDLDAEEVNEFLFTIRLNQVIQFGLAIVMHISFSVFHDKKHRKKLMALDNKK